MHSGTGADVGKLRAIASSLSKIIIDSADYSHATLGNIRASTSRMLETSIALKKTTLSELLLRHYTVKRCSASWCSVCRAQLHVKHTIALHYCTECSFEPEYKYDRGPYAYYCALSKIAPKYSGNIGDADEAAAQEAVSSDDEFETLAVHRECAFARDSIKNAT